MSSGWRRSKLFRPIVRLLKLLGLTVLLILVASPVRNVLFRSVLPGVWTDHNSAFLIKMLLDVQNFPVDTVPRSPSPVKVPVNLHDIRNKFTNKQSYAVLEAQKKKLAVQAKTDLVAQNTLDILSMFEPIMNEEERAISLFTMDVFKRACEAANLTYFLVSGTMLGSLRHHGLIPWDDDFDIAMEASQWVKTRDVLSNIDGFELYSPADSQWKFYMSSLPKANKPFKWPNIDIFFYLQDDNYLWSVTWGIKYALTYHIKDVFPLDYHRFEYWDLPLPKENHFLSSLEFGKGYLRDCVTVHYVHKTNTVVAKKNIGLMPCQKIHFAFPFVFNHPGKVQGTIREELKVGSRSLANLTVPIQSLMPT